MPALSAINQPLLSIVSRAKWHSINAYSIIEVNVPFVHEIIMIANLFFRFLLDDIKT